MSKTVVVYHSGYGHTQRVAQIVADIGAKGPGDMGRVMGAAKAQLGGKAEMGQVSAAVKKALSN